MPCASTSFRCLARASRPRVMVRPERVAVNAGPQEPRGRSGGRGIVAATMRASARELLESGDFKRLTRRRWTVSLVFTAGLFALYYGYILLVAYAKPALGAPLVEGGVTTRGIVLGAAVIVGAWVLTALYVVWANRSYDPEVQRLREHLAHDDQPRAPAARA